MENGLFLISGFGKFLICSLAAVLMIGCGKQMPTPKGPLPGVGDSIPTFSVGLSDGSTVSSADFSDTVGLVLIFDSENVALTESALKPCRRMVDTNQHHDSGFPERL